MACFTVISGKSLDGIAVLKTILTWKDKPVSHIKTDDVLEKLGKVIIKKPAELGGLSHHATPSSTNFPKENRKCIWTDYAQLQDIEASDE